MGDLYTAVTEDEDRVLAFRGDLKSAVTDLFDTGATREASALVRILHGATYQEAARAEHICKDQVVRAVAYLRTRLKDYEEGL